MGINLDFVTPTQREPKRHRCYQCRQMAECWRWKDDRDGKEYALCQRCLGRWIDAEKRRLQSTTT